VSYHLHERTTNAPPSAASAGFSVKNAPSAPRPAPLKAGVAPGGPVEVCRVTRRAARGSEFAELGEFSVTLSTLLSSS
jgi:hypothetical protein